MKLLMKKTYRTIALPSCLFLFLVQLPLFTLQSADRLVANNSMDYNSKSVMLAPRVTADDQLRASEREDEVTRQIRLNITDDKSFSMRARNITIVTLGDRILLKGKVDSKQEMNRITTMAQTMAGNKSVRNDLTYKK